MFDVVLKLFQISHWALPAFPKIISVHGYLFSNYFQHVTFGALAVSAQDTCNNCTLSLSRGRGEATTRVTGSIVGANLMKLHRVVKSARETACCYCHKIECLHAKWQDHISRHFQCFVESWAEKVNSFGETGYNNYSYCDGKEIRNHFLQLYVSIYYTSNLAMLWFLLNYSSFPLSTKISEIYRVSFVE